MNVCQTCATTAEHEIAELPGTCVWSTSAALLYRRSNQTWAYYTLKSNQYHNNRRVQVYRHQIYSGVNSLQVKSWCLLGHFWGHSFWFSVNWNNSDAGYYTSRFRKWSHVYCKKDWFFSKTIPGHIKATSIMLLKKLAEKCFNTPECKPNSHRLSCLAC